jgi:cupin 2 domain-containing protein
VTKIAPPSPAAPLVKIIPWEGQGPPPSQEEVEARLHQEGYESFKWYDVPGAQYPKHRHSQDECLWILRGELVLEVSGQEYFVKSGDRIYLPARTPHTARVPAKGSVTYIIGQKDSSRISQIT